MDQPDSPPPSRLTAWLQLLRIANLPSALANILMGFLLAHQSWVPVSELICLLLATSGFYLGGMVLNDVYDLEIDRQQRPERPLPSALIARSTAWGAGWLLIIAGLLFALLALVFVERASATMVTRNTVIAIMLAASIVLYDGMLKRTWVAPILMGLCRTLNVLLGASTCHWGASWGFPVEVWWVAASVGILICGITLLGRNEAVEGQPRLPLATGGLLVLVGLAGIATLPLSPSETSFNEAAKGVFPLFIGLISIPIVRRVIGAVATAQPAAIQGAVISVLRSLVVLDAAVCFLVVPSQPVFALAVLALLVPGLLLGRVVRPT